jgi:hypothetical protein
MDIRFWWENPERDHLEDLGVVGRIILKLILVKEGRTPAQN